MDMYRHCIGDVLALSWRCIGIALVLLLYYVGDISVLCMYGTDIVFVVYCFVCVVGL